MKRFIFVGLICLSLWNCKSTQLSQNSPNILKFSILQINDVYEISPLSGGKEGGLARVAHIRKELLKKNPHTITVLAGDFLSPSLLGTLKNAEGERVAGAQMVDVLNQLGLDYAIFGNHEFDLKEEQLLKRLQESDFQWISTNAFHKTQAKIEAFYQKQKDKNEAIPLYSIHQFGSLKVGLLGLVLDFNKAPYVEYEDVYKKAQEVNNSLLDKTDIMLAITHLALDQDSLLAQKLPNLKLIIGGHEHQNNKLKVGEVIIAKADANAKTVYVHHFEYNLKNKTCKINSELIKIDDTIPEDSLVKKTVNKWQDWQNLQLKQLGYDANNIVLRLKNNELLDGRESSVRNFSTNYTRLISQAILQADASVDVTLFNAGALRVDDQLAENVSEFDILRSFPFEDQIVMSEMKGETLEKVLEIGTYTNKNNGGFLHFAQAEQKNQTWYIKGKPLDKTKTYRVSGTKFVLSGKESNLDFLKEIPFSTYETCGIRKVKNDFRMLIIDYLKHL